MTKFAISQPMQGKTQEEIKAERERIKTNFQNEGWEFVETLQETLPADTPHVSLWCLGASLVNMADCDYVIFLKGWKTARGCRLEHDACEAYGVKTIEID